MVNTISTIRAEHQHQWCGVLTHYVFDYNTSIGNGKIEHFLSSLYDEKATNN